MESPPLGSELGQLPKVFRGFKQARRLSLPFLAVRPTLSCSLFVDCWLHCDAAQRRWPAQAKTGTRRCLAPVSQDVCCLRLLERVGLSSPEEQDHETSPLTESTMRRLVVYPLPKNMGPGESEGRRAARARALLLQHQNDEGAVYVDVAKVKNKDAYVAAAVAATTGKIVTSCSVRTRSASQAEEMAIALAARSPGVRTILSDSKTAIRSFSRGAPRNAASSSVPPLADEGRISEQLGRALGNTARKNSEAPLFELRGGEPSSGILGQEMVARRFRGQRVNDLPFASMLPSV
ncbi:hypothetical protein MRX96_003255 [Rhipicephalus microplus]